jgi:hypothetical protein
MPVFVALKSAAEAKVPSKKNRTTFMDREKSPYITQTPRRKEVFPNGATTRRLNGSVADSSLKNFMAAKLTT